MLRLYVIDAPQGLLILNAADDAAALARVDGGKILYRSELMAGLSPSLVCRSSGGLW